MLLLSGPPFMQCEVWLLLDFDIGNQYFKNDLTVNTKKKNDKKPT